MGGSYRGVQTVEVVRIWLLSDELIADKCCNGRCGGYRWTAGKDIGCTP